QLHLLHMDPRLVTWISALLEASAYLGLLWLVHKTPATLESQPRLLLSEALAFCALPLLEPVSHRIAFVVLLWPAMVVGMLLTPPGLPSPRSKLLICAAVAIEAVEPLIMGKLYAGTSGWAYPQWKPEFYPAKLPAAKFLGYYASRLNSVELNYTFRRFPTEKLLAGWIASRPRVSNLP